MYNDDNIISQCERKNIASTDKVNSSFYSGASLSKSNDKSDMYGDKNQLVNYAVLHSLKL